MEIEQLKLFIIDRFGTSPDYNYLVVPSTNKSGYADIYGNGVLLCLLSNHSTVRQEDNSKITVKYNVIHELKLVVFQDMVTVEENYG